MPIVVVHRPGTSEEGVYWHNPATGEDEPRVKWTFNATVDGQLGISFVLCPPGAPEGFAADRVYARLMAHPEWLEGILSTDGGGGGGGGGGPSGPAGSGDGTGVDGSPNKKVKTDGGGSSGGGGGGGGGGEGGPSGPAGGGDGGGVIVTPPKMKTADGT